MTVAISSILKYRTFSKSFKNTTRRMINLSEEEDEKKLA